MKNKGLFPDSRMEVTAGIIDDSGTGYVEGSENGTPQRWVEIKSIKYTRIPDGLYHARKGEEVRLVHNPNGEVVAYKNVSNGTHSTPSYSGIIGVLSLALILSAILYLMGVWNLIWKSGWNWWITIAIIFIYCLYAVLWTSLFVMKEWRRQKRAHELLNK